MPAFLLNFLPFLKGIEMKHVLIAIGGAVLAVFIYVAAAFVDSKYEADMKIDRLETQIDGYEFTLEVMRKAAEQKDRAIDAANAARAELENMRPTYEAIQRDAASAKDEDDGEIAPVLRRTLDALDGL